MIKSYQFKFYGKVKGGMIYILNGVRVRYDDSWSKSSKYELNQLFSA